MAQRLSQAHPLPQNARTYVTAFTSTIICVSLFALIRVEGGSDFVCP